MKRITLVLTAAALLLGACATGKTIDREALMTVNTVAVVSVTTEKLGGKASSPENAGALQAMLSRAAAALTRELEARCGWAVLTPAPAPLASAAEQMEADPYFRFWAKGRQDQLVGLTGSPVVPHRNLDPNRVPDPGPNYSDTYVNKVTTQRRILATLGELCTALDVDAVIVVYVDKKMRTVGDIRVSIGGRRTNGTITYNPSFALVSRTGELIYDRGEVRMDDLAPFSMGVPIYRGRGQNTVLDLNHPDVTEALVDLEARGFGAAAGELAEILTRE